MCGRFTITEENQDEVARVLGVPVEQLVEWSYTPRYNVAPMQPYWIVTSDQEARSLRPATWGLVNWYETSRREGAKHINARADSLASRRPYREAFAATRCVVPADGFFEWSAEGKQRIPTWFHRPDRQVFGFAGLFTSARLAGESEPTTTFTIITTEPNEVVARVHDRMPVILTDDAAMDEWLYPKQTPKRLQELLVPAPVHFLTATPVSTRVNSVVNDDPECIEEVPPRPGQGTLLL
ncbi:MAG: SOS response-associated peptidase [Dehalococcoidia bacterium]|nr:MAG: SOS response-associated peptidase [Dehalococcoidia bacterium]